MAVATTVGGSITFNEVFTQTLTSGLITTQAPQVNINLSYTYGNGTAAGQIDYIYGKSLSLAAAATTLDLTALTDLGGGAVNFARIRELCIVNLATTAAFIVTIGNAATNAWSTGPLGTATSTCILMPSVSATTGNSALRWADVYSTGAATGGYVDATHKNLKLDPGANTISVYVFLAGCSAVS